MEFCWSLQLVRGDTNWKTWQLLRTVMVSLDIPTIVACDFNEILANTKKIGGITRNNQSMAAFHSILGDYGLADLGFHGPPFTWSRGKRVATRIEERLDRFVADPYWQIMFPSASIKHLPRFVSDHNPILLYTYDSTLRPRKRL